MKLARKRVIFIGGSSYSGSTLLDMMLDSGKKGFSAGEVSALFYPYRSHHVNPLSGCSKQECTIWKEIKPFGPKNLYRAIFNRFSNVSHIVDSSKDYVRISAQAKQLDQIYS